MKDGGIGDRLSRRREQGLELGLTLNRSAPLTGQNAWELLKVERREETVTVDSVLQECLFFNPLIPDAALRSGVMLHAFIRGGVKKLGDLVKLEKGTWKPAEELARTLAVHSIRWCVSSG
ncbi:hypothetical protein SKAU_G00275710 [Synaphobranchus kaupii]|uniref:Uncharacterized protein n=1 Tax=Synaphobranchus kaupii TaxID=118154 RepID=A0A9Q1F169_SYNKA|nr:hypothetical protein SKAU_G00275710 [Synaphobranchus kaupii]